MGAAAIPLPAMTASVSPARPQGSKICSAMRRRANDHDGMKTLAVISILALLTISGAAYTDQLLTSDQQTMQRAD
jgi:hypothetical protein